MARKKADINFLTEKECEDFIVYIKKNKISKSKMAEIQGVSGGTVSNWFKKKKILRALKENVECRVERKVLKDTVDNIKSNLK